MNITQIQLLVKDVLALLSSAISLQHLCIQGSLREAPILVRTSDTMTCNPGGGAHSSHSQHPHGLKLTLQASVDASIHRVIDDYK